MIAVVPKDDHYKVHVVVKLIGERYAYEVVFKATKTFLTPETGDFDKCFEEAKNAVRQVMEGKKELNAITS